MADGTKITQSWRGRKLVNSFSAIPGFAARELVLDVERVSSCHHWYAEMHGWKAKMLDTAAVKTSEMVNGVKVERDVAVVAAEKFAAMEDAVKYFHSGAIEWNRKGGPGPWAPSDDLVTVVAGMRKVDVSRAREFLTELGETNCAALGADKQIAEKIAAMVRARSQVDVGAMLAKLGA
jgi:hypothetical protein